MTPNGLKHFEPIGKTGVAAAKLRFIQETSKVVLEPSWENDG